MKTSTSTTTLTRRQLLAGTGALVLSALCKGSVHAAGPNQIKLRDLYNKDLTFSDLARSIADTRVAISGYMAPPLKSQSRFFVLTKRPMATCPFCNDADDWPDDLIAVYAKRVIDVQPFNVALVVSGKLELGDYKDPENGFFSRARLVNATYKRQRA